MKNLFFLLSSILVFSVLHTFSQQSSTTSANSEVIINVTVTDFRGKSVAGLDKNAFTISSGKEKAEITSFITGEPTEVLFLFEKSKETSNFYRKAGSSNQSILQQLLSRFMQSSDASNNYTMFAFRKTQEQILSSTNNQNNVLNAVNNLDGLQLDPPTSFIDACYFGIEKLSQSNSKKRALILFTTGEDRDSKHTTKELIKLLKENNITLYIVGIFGERGFISANPDTMSDTVKSQITRGDFFQKLAEISGGKAYYPLSVAEFAEIFSRMGNELRNQYMIGIKLAGLLRRINHVV